MTELTSEEREFVDEFDLEPGQPVSGWDGYVDPKGNFYTTKPSGIGYYQGSFNLHADWADAHYLAKGIRENELRGKIVGDIEILKTMDYLIYADGWVSCTFNLGDRIYIQVPNKERLTEAQRKTVFSLFEINKYPMDVYFRACEPRLHQKESEG